MDGASEWRVYRHVVFPHLRPVTLSALIILGHISIKVFDLIVAIGGKQLITQTPAVYMWILIYDARDYAKGAAIATLLLVGISVLDHPVPHLHDPLGARGMSTAVAIDPGDPPSAPAPKTLARILKYAALAFAARHRAHARLRPARRELQERRRGRPEPRVGAPTGVDARCVAGGLERRPVRALPVPQEQPQARHPGNDHLDGPRLAERLRPLAVALPRVPTSSSSSSSSGCSSRTRR